MHHRLPQRPRLPRGSARRELTRCIRLFFILTNTACAHFNACLVRADEPSLRRSSRPRRSLRQSPHSSTPARDARARRTRASLPMQAIRNMFGGAGGERVPMKINPKHFILKTDVTTVPSGHASFVAATGCFWGSEKMFWRVPGVRATSVGYIAGKIEHPTYEEICGGRTGHAECVRVIYDPKIVSFADLLAMHWTSHDPTQGDGQGNDRGTQYRSGLYCSTDEQLKMARDSREAYQGALRAAGKNREITTEIKGPGDTFYFAEDYHQQYLGAFVFQISFATFSRLFSFHAQRNRDLESTAAPSPRACPCPLRGSRRTGGNLGRVFGPSTVPNRGARSASRTRKSRSTPRSKQSERLHGRPRRFNRHPAVYNQHNQPMRTFTARAPRRAIDRRPLDVSARLVFSNGFIHPNTTLTKITIAFSAIRGTLR